MKRIYIAAYHQSKFGKLMGELLGKIPKELQVSKPGVAATFNIGGPICASVCTVLKPAV